METSNYIVTVARPRFGAYTGSTFDQVYKFRNEAKARDFYTDMLVKYPDCKVTIENR